MATYDNEWIVRYVDGELSPEETGPFEAAMRADAGLAAEVELCREMKAVLSERLPEDRTREDLVQRMAGLNREYFGGEVHGASRVASGSRPVIIRRLITFAAAASILVAVVLLWPGDRGRRIDELGQTEMIGVTERGDQTDTLLQKAAVLFNQKQFDNALPLLNRAVAADSSSQLALFYRGIAAWHTGDIALARRSLQQVYDHGSVLQSQSAFYMALIYAGEKNKEKALEWLQKIPASDPEFLKANELERILK